MCALMAWLEMSPDEKARMLASKWSPLSAPVDPAETMDCMRAQSALSGPELGAVHDLTITQARDVLAWYDPKY